MVKVEMSYVELMALKKLAIVNGTLAKALSGVASREQTALTKVLIEVINRCELSNEMENAK